MRSMNTWLILIPLTILLHFASSTATVQDDGLSTPPILRLQNRDDSSSSPSSTSTATASPSGSDATTKKDSFSSPSSASSTAPSSSSSAPATHPQIPSLKRPNDDCGSDYDCPNTCGLGQATCDWGGVPPFHKYVFVGTAFSEEEFGLMALGREVMRQESCADEDLGCASVATKVRQRRSGGIFCYGAAAEGHGCVGVGR